MRNSSSVLTLQSLCQAFGGLHQAVSDLVRAARAVVRAHFDSMDQEQYRVRARMTDVVRCLEEEYGKTVVKGTESPWKAALDLLGEGHGGVTLLQGAEWAWFGENRTVFGASRRFIPTVFQMVRRILGNVIPRGVLHDLYRTELRDRYLIDDSPHFIHFALKWLECFNAVTKRKVALDDLLSLGGATNERDRQWVWGLIEVLGFLSILVPNVRRLESSRKSAGSNHELLRVYRIQHNADPAYVFSNLFGRSTGILGLDYLFYGGLWGPGGEGGQENLNIVISGGPGLGKSTLAGAMAAQVAARGGFALYLHFQLDSRTLVRQFHQYYRKLLPFFKLEVIGEPVPDASLTPATQPSDGGRLVISVMPTATHEVIEASLLKLIQDVDSRNHERLVVFDAISACEGYGKPISAWRKFLEGLTLSLRTRGFTVAFLVERDTRRGDGFEHYLSDVDLRLTATRVDGYLFRTLRIAKSRWQACHRGNHTYTIRTDEGMRVFPSSAANITVEWKREPHIRVTERVIDDQEAIDPGVESFIKYLGRVGPDRASGLRQSWWIKGSVTALIGPRGTLKTTFGIAFCDAVGGDERGFLPSALFLHLAAESSSGRTGQAFSRAIGRPCPVGTRYDIPLSSDSRSAHSSVTHLFFRSGYLAPGQVLHVVRELIGEKRDHGAPIRRAVIADAGNILPDFPALKKDPAFIPALCSLLASEGITTLLIYSRPEHGGPDYIIDQVRSTSQNILQSDRIYYGGRLRVAVSVSRSIDEAHDRGIYELEKTAHSERRVRIVNSLDLVLDALSGSPQVAKIHLILHAETVLQRRYHEGLLTFHQGFGSYTVNILTHAVGLSHYRVAREVIAGERALWITQVDSEYSSGYLETAEGEPLFCDLTSWDHRVHKLNDELVTHPEPPLARARRSPRSSLEPNTAIRSLPFYLNPSFLIVRRDFGDYLRNNLSSDFGAALTGTEYTWRMLLDGARNFQPMRKDNVAAPLFDCPMETTENLNCVFLEILASLCGGARVVNELDFSTDFKPGSRLLTGEGAPLLQAASILRECLHGTLDWHLHRSRDLKNGDFAGLSSSGADVTNRVQQPTQLIRNYSTSSDPATNPDALFQRHWYSTYRQMACDAAEGCPWINRDFEAIRLPGGLWTCGDWHLAILEGSVGVRSGVSILVDEFLTRGSASARMVQGVGLPPHRAFYLGQPDSEPKSRMPVLRVGLSWFRPYVEGDERSIIFRSRIVGYQEAAPLLNGTLHSIISAPESHPDLLCEHFSSLHEILNSFRLPKKG